MSDQISIKVNIAERSFQIKVKMEDEEHIRKAVDLINNRVRTYIETYGVKDKQAALSMCALELTSELLNTEAIKVQEINNLDVKLTEIEQLLDKI
jgi:cell division protein ZapA